MNSLLGYVTAKSHGVIQMPGRPQLGFTEFPIIKSGKIEVDSLKVSFMNLSNQQLKILWSLLTDHDTVADAIRASLATREKIEVKGWYQFNPVLKACHNYFKSKSTSLPVVQFAALYMTHIMLEAKIASFDGGVNSYVDSSTILESSNVFERTLKAYQYDELDFSVEDLISLVNKKINRSQIGVQAFAMYISNYFRSKQMELMKLQQETTQIIAGLEICAKVLERQIFNQAIVGHSVVTMLTKSINFAIDFVAVDKLRVSAAIKDIDTGEMLLYLSTLDMFISKYFEYGHVADMIEHISMDIITCHDDDDVINSVIIWKESDIPSKYNVFNSIRTGDISFYSPTSWEPQHYPLRGSQFIPQIKKIMGDLSVDEFKKLEFDDTLIGFRSQFPEYNSPDEALEPMIITNCSPLEINLMLISMFKDGAQFGEDGSIKYVHIDPTVRIKSEQLCLDNCTINPNAIITSDPVDALFGIINKSEIVGKKIEFINASPTIMPNATSGFYNADVFMDTFSFPDTSDYNKSMDEFKKEHPSFVVTLEIEGNKVEEMISIGQELTGAYDSSWPVKKHIGHANQIIQQYLSFKDTISKSELKVDSAFKIFNISLLSSIITETPSTLRLTRQRLGKLRGKKDYRKVELDISLKYATTLGRVFGKWNAEVVKELYSAVESLDSAEIDALAANIIKVK